MLEAFKELVQDNGLDYPDVNFALSLYGITEDRFEHPEYLTLREISAICNVADLNEEQVNKLFFRKEEVTC